MNKKGMAINQVFVFMIAGLIFALILIFGYQAISGFIDTGEAVLFTKFKTSIEADVQKIHTDFGSIRKKSYTLPSGYEEVCFVNMDRPYPADCSIGLLACDTWKTSEGYKSIDQNVFLKPSAPAIKVAPITLTDGEDKPQDSLCIKLVSGVFTIILEGKGDHAVISPVS
ncbi:hypothetical protein COV12_00320 [Candidatus Woesearchaeota archaeon CG10_big_fil_rev_8_21_14_0_10_32_24]|nr:MAG: hypothetical protein COV12_00320 [Candidatus Woesearchaeota archaeon CG10_big_fil_rev_8_21_14_0_10_32_24]